MSEGPKVEARSFGRIVAKLGFATQEQVRDCLHVQKKMREMGVSEPLGEIMVKKGVLSEKQVSQALKALGQQVDPIPGYKLVRKIGQGGMGAVYEAKQLSIDRPVAIKILSSLLTKEDPTFVKRLFAEAHSAAKLNHPNIVSAIDAGDSNGTFYFVMEYVEGKSVSDMIDAKKPIPTDQVIDIAIQTTQALLYLHDHKLLHRDIKPDNLIVSTDGTVKLCDFGLAKSTTSLDQSLTVEGMTVGTPYYMSPEQVRGVRDLDIRSDLYSLGASVYKMVTGRFVFDGHTPAETMAMHLQQAPRDPRKVRKGVGDGMAAVLMRLLEKAPEDRYQSPAELMEDLKKLSQGEAVAHTRRSTHSRRAVKSGIRHSVRRPRRKDSTVPIVIGASLVLLLVIVFVAMSSGGSEPEDAREANKPDPKPRPRIEKREPTENPVKVAAAGTLDAKADAAFQEGRWVQSRTLYQQLLKEFGSLKSVKTRAGDIGGRIGLCDVEIEKLKKYVDSRHAKARSAMQKENWEEAITLLEPLLKSDVETMHVRRSVVERDLQMCRRESPPRKLMSQWAESWQSQDWKAVIGYALEMRNRHAQTDTFRRNKKILEHSLQSAEREVAAEKILVEMRVAVAKSDWRPLPDLLSRMFREYHDTETYKWNEDEIKEAQTRLAAGDKTRAEAAAKREWLNVQAEYGRLYGNKSYPQCLDLLEAFARQHQATTYYQNELSKLVQNRIDKARTAILAGREKTARSLRSDITSLHRKGRFLEAYEKIQELEKEYGDTKTASDRGIARIRKEIEKKIGLSEEVLYRMDFGSDKPAWRNDSDGQKPDAQYEKGGMLGEECVRLRFPTHNGSFSHLLMPLPAQRLKKAVRITFYVRSLNDAHHAGRFFVREEPWESWGADFTITREWKPVTIELSRLTYIWGDNTNRKFEWDKVTELGFMMPDKGTHLEFAVDLLTVEKE